MTGQAIRAKPLRIGTDENVIRHSDTATLRTYLTDRPGPAPNVAAAELVLDVALSFARPVGVVWAATKDFNRWQNRYGYVWDGTPADEEGQYLHLSNHANDFGGKIEYLIRKVIPKQALYFDSMPMKLPGMDVTWSGHNMFNYAEAAGTTMLSVFMEHTFFSSSMSIEELRALPRGMIEDGVRFWRDYFIPDLQTVVQKA